MSTLTHRVAAIQVKMLHLQYRMVKIYNDQEHLSNSKKSNVTPRESIKHNNGAVYSTIDMIITFEHVYQLLNDIFATPELKNKFDDEITKILGDARKTAQKWVSVRNRLGGHIDIKIVEEFCKQNNYSGVFLSNDLEADVGVLNMFMIASALNMARSKSDIIGRDLNLKKNGISTEAKLIVDVLNRDWNQVFGYFKPMMEFLYKYGKEEKELTSIPHEKLGIVFD